MSRDTTTPIPCSSEDVVSTPDRLGRLPEAIPPTNGNGEAGHELPVADFMEPVEYAWTAAGFKARQALKWYSEQAHPDWGDGSR